MGLFRQILAIPAIIAISLCMSCSGGSDKPGPEGGSSQFKSLSFTFPSVGTAVLHDELFSARLSGVMAGPGGADVPIPDTAVWAVTGKCDGVAGDFTCNLSGYYENERMASLRLRTLGDWEFTATVTLDGKSSSTTARIACKDIQILTCIVGDDGRYAEHVVPVGQKVTFLASAAWGEDEGSLRPVLQADGSWSLQVLIGGYESSVVLTPEGYGESVLNGSPCGAWRFSFTPHTVGKYSIPYKFTCQGVITSDSSTYIPRSYQAYWTVTN